MEAKAVLADRGYDSDGIVGVVSAMGAEAVATEPDDCAKLIADYAIALAGKPRHAAKTAEHALDVLLTAARATHLDIPNAPSFQ